MSTLAMAATGTVTAVLGMAAMYVPARLARYDAHMYNALAEDKLTKVEARDAEYERTRNLPWYWPTDRPELPAAEPMPEAEVLHVAYPTQELHTVKMPAEQFDELVAGLNEADYAPRLAALADEVGLVQALSDRPAEDELCDGCGKPWRECAEDDSAEHAAKHEPDRTGIWLVLLGLARDLGLRVWHFPTALGNGFARWVGDVSDWAVERFKSDAARAREWEQIEGGPWSWDNEQRAQGVTEPEPEPVRIVHVNHRYRDPGMTGAYPLVKVVGDKAAGRHRLRPEPEMPAVNPIPAQRDGGDDL